MASFKLKFRPSTIPGREGTLYFSVTHHRAVKTLFTEYHVFEEEWNPSTSFIRIKGTPERQAWLRMAASMLRWDIRQLTRIITEKEEARVEYDVADIVSEFQSLPPCQTFFGFVEGVVAKVVRIGRHGTAKTYIDALRSFSGFRQGEDIALDALDEDTIMQYEAWLKSRGLKRNSSSCYLRTLRTLYRKAVDKGLTTDKDIFRRVFTGFAVTNKRSISVDAVREIMRLHLPDGSSVAFARDMFMLTIWLQGISFVDLAHLRKNDLQNGLLRYSRMKTRQDMAVRWEPAMQRIVDEYAHLTEGSPYLLPILNIDDGKERTERQQYVRMEHLVNRNLKKVGRMAGLQIPLTTYVARHTWASVMRDLTGDLSIVSKGLGHASLKTTQIYLASIDNATVANANRKMINLIMKGKK